MYIVTGGLGFIGSNIVKELADRGKRVLIVDDRSKIYNRMSNISDCAFAIDNIINPGALTAWHVRDCEGIFHQGACADTTEKDSALMMRQNVDSSKAIIDLAVMCEKKLVYASSAAVYGDSHHFTENPENERPLNQYGLSKLIVDNYVRSIFNGRPDHKETLVGLRYFNVYGPREGHKGKMKSMVNQLISQGQNGRRLSIFRDGSQKRDFVHVSDVVNVNMHFMFDEKKTKGIFNVGTGDAVSFQELAYLVAVRCDLTKDDIDHIDIPAKIAPYYQSFTRADIDALRAAGYDKKFMNIADGVRSLTR